MSRRSIPPVRRWRVRYWFANDTYHDVYVQTINKQFARWFANDRTRGFDWWWEVNRVSVTLAPIGEGKPCATYSLYS